MSGSRQLAPGGTQGRHVLVVAYDFPPHGAIGTMRTLRVVAQLAEQGYRVTVLTSDPASFSPGTPIEQELLERVPPGVRVVRAGTWRFSRLTSWVRRGTAAGGRGSTPAHKQTLRPRRVPARIRRWKAAADALFAIPDRHAGWCVPAVARGVAAAIRHGRPDVIYSSAPPWTGQLVALGLARILRRPWVADFRDPWSRAPWREDRLPFVIRANAALERRVVARADAVIFVTRANRDDFARAYGERTAAKLHYVPNGCDPAEFADLVPRRPQDGRFILLHAGSLYGARNPLPLCRVIARLIARGTLDPARFRLRLVGPINVAGVDLEAECRRLGLDGVVEFAGRLSRRDTLREMVSASALLLLQPITTVSVPGKAYEYLAAGRPILALAEQASETSQLVREAGAGYTAQADDEAAIERALTACLTEVDTRDWRVSRQVFDGHERAREAVALIETVRASRGTRPVGGMAAPTATGQEP